MSIKREPSQLLLEVLATYADADQWVGQTFERIRRIPNTQVGDVGQDFVERLCEETNFRCDFPMKDDGTRLRQNPWDIRIEGTAFELKTASEDVSGSFQFNHIRYHRPYDALLCIGISPSDIFMGAWSKADVTTGKAGTLVSMEKGANASYKLTKRPDQLVPISGFEKLVPGFGEKSRCIAKFIVTTFFLREIIGYPASPPRADRSFLKNWGGVFPVAAHLKLTQKAASNIRRPQEWCSG